MSRSFTGIMWSNYKESISYRVTCHGTGNKGKGLSTSRIQLNGFVYYFPLVLYRSLGVVWRQIIGLSFVPYRQHCFCDIITAITRRSLATKYLSTTRKLQTPSERIYIHSWGEMCLLGSKTVATLCRLSSATMGQKQLPHCE